MINPQSSEPLPYGTEVDSAVAKLPDDLLARIQAVGVRWEYAEGVGPDLFVPRIYRAVGYYSVLLDVGAQLPPYIDGSIHETREESHFRRQTTAKHNALVEYLPSILAGMDEQATITTIVEDITGVTPRWGNVTRAVAEGRIQ